jgi:hypothetical protein
MNADGPIPVRITLDAAAETLNRAIGQQLSERIAG